MLSCGAGVHNQLSAPSFLRLSDLGWKHRHKLQCVQALHMCITTAKQVHDKSPSTGLSTHTQQCYLVTNVHRAHFAAQT